MRNKIIILGSIVFASNVVLGETLVTLPQSSEIVSQIPIPFEQNIASELMSRGLEEQAAKEFSQNCVTDVYSATLLTHILSTKLQIEKEEIHAYIASQALFNKTVNLKSHADVVALVQKIKGFKTQSEDLKAIEGYLNIV